MYILDLYQRGLSRKNGGGTLLSYATNVSHLIRFCYYNKVDFLDLTDQHFSFFIKSLSGERGPRRRNSLPSPSHMRNTNSVIAIGRNCLDFLVSVGSQVGDNDFVGSSGRIVVERREVAIRLHGRRRGAVKVQEYLYHHSFPTPDPKKRRLPISALHVTKLYDAVHKASTSIYLRKRRYVMLKLLEITGGRRSEVAALTVESVVQAAAMDEPRLKLETAKARSAKIRFIPIARHDVELLKEFIDINRRRIIRKTCGLPADDGYVLVSETTGRKIRPNTVTQEIRGLANAAGISEQTCPHMFRHAFITNLFVALIEQHQVETEDAFRRSLFNVEAVKQEILAWTGQSDVHSLEPYIHMALAKHSKFEKAVNAVSLHRLIDTVRTTVHLLSTEIQGGMPAGEACRQLVKLTADLERDLSRLITTE